jgi:hypothetical protein
MTHSRAIKISKMTQYNRNDNKNATLYRMTKHDDTHSNNKKCDTQYNDTAQRHVMLIQSIIMLNVIGAECRNYANNTQCCNTECSNGRESALNRAQHGSTNPG